MVRSRFTNIFPFTITHFSFVWFFGNIIFDVNALQLILLEGEAYRKE